MQFRTTSFSSSRQSIRFASQYNASIIKYQQQISSGIKIHRPSDDPISFRQIESFTVRLQELQTEAYAVVDTETKLNTSVSQLQQTHDLISRAKNLAQQGVQATGQSEREALAVELDGLMINLQNITRTKSAGSYLYAGARSDQEPFEFNDPGVPGGTLEVVYQGSSNQTRAYIGDAISFDTFYSGDQIFGDPDRQETRIMGTSGAKIGAGTDNMIGRATLQVRHSLTTFQGTSGIAPGASSPTGDTLIDPVGENTLIVRDTSGTGDSGTIELNQGEVVNWTRSDTDLKVTDNIGRMIHVDMSAISPGFDGVVDFSSDGTLSVDGGLTEVPIDFSASQTITDSVSGRQTHIDTRELNRTGDDYLDFPGTSDVFQVLYELSQDLRNSRGLDNVALADSIDQRFGELDRIGDHVLVVVAEQSASLQTLRELDFRIQDLQLEVETQLSEIQSTDIPTAVLRMQNDQALLEYTYAVSAQIASTSLIDFLR
jgi:flagellar hook-associated protein 3